MLKQFQVNLFPLQDRKHQTSTEYKAEAKIEIPFAEFSGSLSTTDDVSKRQQQDGKIPDELEGFSKLGQYESNTFNPATSATTKEDKVRLTVYQLEENGEKKFLAENLSREPNDSCIVTKKGGIVKSLDKDNTWVDMNGHCHNEPSACSPDCYGCYAKSRSKRIFWILAEIRQAVMEEKREELLKEVDQITEKYRNLEIKTLNVILEIQLHGKNIVVSLRCSKQARDDGNEEKIDDAIKLLQNDMMGKLKDLKYSLDEVIKEHWILVDDVTKIKKELNGKKLCSESYFEEIENYLFIKHEYISRIPKMLEKLEVELDDRLHNLFITKERLVDTDHAIGRTTRAQKNRKEIVNEAEEKAEKLINICDEILPKLKTHALEFSRDM